MNDKDLVNVVSWCALRRNYSMKKARYEDLTLRCTAVLVYVASFGSVGVIQGDIRKHLRIESCNMVGGQNYLGKLIDLGLVYRSRSAGRFFICFATPAGLRMSRKILREIKEFSVIVD